MFAQADNKVEIMKRHLEQTVASSSESSRLTAEQRADMRILDMQKLMAGAIGEVRDDVERGEMFAYKQQTQQAQSVLEDRLVTANDLLDSERAARLKAGWSARRGARAEAYAAGMRSDGDRLAALGGCCNGYCEW